jgi:hypothetical protein
MTSPDPEADPLGCVITNGGPLIAVPIEHVAAWRGVSPPLGATVPEGWTWESGGVVCDYDRACTWPEEAISSDDGAATWDLPVGAGRALVLDGEVQTSAVPAEDGVVLVRNAGLATRAEVLALVAGVAEWRPSPFSLDLAQGRLCVFDAAYAGAERADAEGGVLEADLVPGRYRVMIAWPAEPAGACVTLVRLTGPKQPGELLRIRVS